MKNTITKATIYATVKALVNGENPEISEELKTAILERMDKDIEQASKKSTSKTETENDRLNAKIREVILEVLADGALIYGDFIKTVQAEFAETEVSAQKITANVTKLKEQGAISKYEDGKGKNKKLYITLA